MGEANGHVEMVDYTASLRSEGDIAGMNTNAPSDQSREIRGRRGGSRLRQAPTSCHDEIVSLSKEAIRQALQNKCSYFLGLGTCLLTVITAATMQSLLGASPAVFLRQSENQEGQIDLIMSASGALNFSALRANVEASSKRSEADNSFMYIPDEVTYLSPRTNFGIRRVYENPERNDTSPGPLSRFFLPAIVSALDTNADVRAGIGRYWTLPALKANECYVNKIFADSLGVVTGDTVDVNMLVSEYLDAYVVSHSSAHDFTDFFTLERGNSTAGKPARCVKSARSLQQQADDPILQGATATQCDKKNVLFCGIVTDNTACGMADSVAIRLKIVEVVDSWEYRVRGTGQTNEEDDPQDDLGNGQSGGGASMDNAPRLVIELPHVIETILSGLPRALREQTDVGFYTRNLTMKPPLQDVVEERRLSIGVSASKADALVALSYDQVSEVVGNLPPSFRSDILLQSQYDDIQSSVVQFSGRVVSAAGAIWIDIQNPVMEGLRSNRFTGLYLGMVMDILIAILLGLSSVLIYSLMMINVQSRQFELAVRRMLGATKLQIIALLVAQAMAFALPSVILGLTLAHFITAELFVEFTKLSGISIETDQALSSSGIVYGLVLGIAIPLLGAIGPIRAALGVELREALDVSRAKTKILEYKIESETDRAKISPSILAVGLSLSVFGFLIYYLLPLALLSVNLRVFFAVFVALLLSLIIGLVLLASNLQIITEKMVAALFLGVWTKGVLRRLALKNLIAHRRRNWKTSIMYSLSLAFIIFIAVASQLEFQTLRYDRLRRAGSEIVVLAGDKNTNTNKYWNLPSFTPEEFRKLRSVLLDDSGNATTESLGIESVAWMSGGLDAQIRNVGTTNRISPARILCVSPSFFEVADLTFYSPGPMWMRPKDGALSGLTIAEQLYTARGSQGIVMPTAYLNQLDYPEFKQGAPVAPVSIFREDSSTEPFPTEKESLFKPMAYLSSSPALRMSPYFGRPWWKDVIVAPSTFVSLSDGKLRSAEDIPVSRILLSMKDGASPTKSQYELIKARLEAIAIEEGIALGVWGLADELESFQQLLSIIDFFFVSITLVGLMLCFFSLVASMVSNIAEQAQDIAIIRSIGFSKKDVIKVYIYEAFILVVASAALGCLTGWSIAWTFSSQRSLFTQLPLAFYFPWPIVTTVIGCAIVCALLAAGIPSYKLVQKRITQLLRLFGS